MELFLQILKIIAGPVIGAVIGYFTNYIAVKMLFHPRYPVRIGKFTVPFTPGIIPKRKAALAKALGEAVGTHLFTGTDLKNALISEETKQAISAAVEETLSQNAHTPEEVLLQISDGDSYEAGKESLCKMLSDKLVSAVEEMNVGQIIASQGAEAVKKRLKGNMLSMFISEDLIASFAVPMGQQVNAYISENGRDLVLPEIRKELNAFVQKPISQTVSDLGLQPKTVSAIVLRAYEEILIKNIDGLLSKTDIPAVVEEKVNAMRIEEVERLLLGVMQKELGAVVNLGAVIGFLIGIINIFV